MNIKSFASVQTEVHDCATGALVKISPWVNNTALDLGLTALANGAGFSQIFEKCVLGAGATANYTSSGFSAIFTQAGDTISASIPFFTAGMANAVIKYGHGTSGLEQRITTVNSSQSVTVETSYAQSETPGTVWFVQNEVLESPLNLSHTYDTSAGACGVVSVNAGVIVLQRKFIFANQPASYSVNEIGYTSNAQSATVYGRVVLDRVDTVEPTQFYVVTVRMTYVVSPVSPTAVVDVGTNVDTAGYSGYQTYGFQSVLSNGTTGSYTTAGDAIMDGSVTVSASLVLSSFDLIGSTALTEPSTSNPAYILGSATYSATATLGVGEATIDFSTTTNGETVYGVYLGLVDGLAITQTFAQKFTTSYTLPDGAFTGSVTFVQTFTRTLSNP